jgi:hypothetical protein
VPQDLLQITAGHVVHPHFLEMLADSKLDDMIDMFQHVFFKVWTQNLNAVPLLQAHEPE